MLTQLSTVKARLEIDEFDVKYDALLTNAIKATGARFEMICRRKFARTTNIQQEYELREPHILLTLYPFESLTTWETRTDPNGSWNDVTGLAYDVTQKCVLTPVTQLPCAGRGRITYTAGYVMPGDTVEAGQTALPDDLEQAAVEQVAAWFTNRDKVGLIRNWPKAGVYQEFQQSELLPSVAEVLAAYTRPAMFPTGM